MDIRCLPTKLGNFLNNTKVESKWTKRVGWRRWVSKKGNTYVIFRKQWQWKCRQGDYSSAWRDQNNEIFVKMWFVIYVTLNLFVYWFIVSSLFMRIEIWAMFFLQVEFRQISSFKKPIFWRFSITRNEKMM
jgi:hypothetical protein